ncbi:MAG TPA: hypothetical protein VGZ00_10695 [Candidatus Baltobacteraceae bacterium]|jgi:hypothetical protein|nr:hypothetical protein [Candidatus Baltobacteraceae bacterium]
MSNKNTSGDDSDWIIDIVRGGVVGGVASGVCTDHLSIASLVGVGIGTGVGVGILLVGKYLFDCTGNAWNHCFSKSAESAERSRSQALWEMKRSTDPSKDFITREHVKEITADFKAALAMDSEAPNKQTLTPQKRSLQDPDDNTLYR